ncbi:hypothetical protein PDE_07486 [Penicillium oxalicum 114-2]|uniref:YMC020W-like alpha/beta hydrolase domain-containing protein n=1 Tax=Penicillium oxalicum (strain 114-2 / CGMCC 5302) TaxID=933388 RepID=S7ZUU4_PENO1|nr:hypothetical protein PDE_07486 [Penicillium oxalicum 114-2]
MIAKGSRKRAKASPSGGDSPSPASPNNNARNSSNAQTQSPTSWYPGSWSAISRVYKAAPVTEVARESISAAQNGASSSVNTSPILTDTTNRSRHNSIQLTKKSGASTRSLPAGVTTTRVNIASDGSSSAAALDTFESRTNLHEGATPEVLKSKPTESSQSVVEGEGPNTNIPEPEIENPQATQKQTAQPSGWLSWIYGSGYAEDDSITKTDIRLKTDDPSADAITNQTEAPGTASGNEVANAQQNLRQSETTAQEANTVETAATPQKRSWLQMWYGTGPSNQQEPQATEPTPQTQSPTTLTENYDVQMTAKEPSEQAENVLPPAKGTANAVRSSGWSFWSKDASNDTSAIKHQEVEAVKATVASDPSDEHCFPPTRDTATSISRKETLKIKSSNEIRLKDENRVSAEAIATYTTPAPSKGAEGSASKQLQKILPNQVLPKFEDTYAVEESPSLLRSLSRLLHYSHNPEHVHVARVKEPPRIKRALAIGVHGYFPAPLIRSVLGQPTGTSIRFSNMAADAIRKYTSDHGYTCEVEKIALEGEGRIAERVELLWKLLLNWMEEIRKADFILVACHSQGVPVSMMLVAKLISFGCVNASRVGVCAMAGVNMGPFSSYRSRWISGSAGELFEFELPFSKVSKDYEIALKRALEFGVRISYIGSIDDQLVSLESSLFSPVNHPYIYRSVFVDGRVHAPSFLSHLVGFALKLRNLGIPDHGLIRELSSPLAGSLYTGEGHSRLYDEETVYYMAIQFAMETTSVPSAELNIKRSSPSISPNPYILPFAMRGLLEEEYVRRELHEETMELLRQFDDWKPSTKVLKDVKFRLEGIRSKL